MMMTCAPVNANAWMGQGVSCSVEKLQQFACSGLIDGGVVFALNQQPVVDDGSVWNNGTLVSAFIIACVLLLTALVLMLRYRDQAKKLKRMLDDAKQELAVCNTAREVIQETLQSTEHQRQQLQNDLQKATNEISAFSYSVSHDLRAPLRAINGYSAILLEEHHDHLDESGKRALGIIQQNSSRMDELISDLLELARLGTLAISKQKFNMHQLVKHVLVDKQLKSNTQLNVLPMDEAFADSYLLRQVWENLISNAIKFSSRTETPVIEIGYEKHNGEQVYWVRDNGVGFDPVYSDKLFKVFSRLHGKKEFEGTGAGLAISKKIIEAHGGRIWAEAQLTKGATFYFSLPSSN